MQGYAQGAPAAPARTVHRRRWSLPTRSPLDDVLLDGPPSLLAGLARNFAVELADPLARPPRHGCLVAIALRLGRADTRRQLQTIRQRYPATGLVIVTSGDPANLRNLLGLKADAVSPVEGIESDLPALVRSLRARGPLEIAAAAFEEADGLDPLVRGALLAAVQSMPPVHTVKGLASRIGAAPNRLGERFQAIKRRTGWSCLDLLHAVALWRTVEMLEAGVSLKRALQQLGLDPRTVRRASHGLLGCRPSELLARARELQQAIIKFVEYSLQPGEIDRVPGDIAACRAAEGP